MTNRYPILYSFRRCPYAMRARMALLISGVTCELREVKLSDKPAAMIAASPKATVPVLVLPSGEVIAESLAIMRWALARHDPENWLEYEAVELIAINDWPFKQHLDRYKYPSRYDDVDPVAERQAGLVILQDLEHHLRQNGALCRSTRSFADIATMPFVRQFAHTDREWFDAQTLPHLHIWLAQLKTSDVFNRAMVKHPIWQDGQDITLFPAP